MQLYSTISRRQQQELRESGLLERCARLALDPYPKP